MPDAIEVWETDGGYSPPINDRECPVCDDLTGPMILQDNGSWVHLRHLPKLAEVR